MTPLPCPTCGSLPQYSTQCGMYQLACDECADLDHYNCVDSHPRWRESDQALATQWNEKFHEGVRL